MRCTAKFFRTGFRGSDAHNIDCYYYQWHSHEVSWDCFDDEGALYHNAFGGLIKASALFFGECYPTLHACIRNDERKLARVANYWTTYFYDVRRFGAAQRAQLEKLIDSLYKLLAFYTNWMWQVLRTLPPTLRPERQSEARIRELRDVYHRLVDAQADFLRCEAAQQGAPDGEEADPHDRALKNEYRQLKYRLDELIPSVGGNAFLTALQTEKEARTEKLEGQRQALAEQDERIARMEGEDAHLTDPRALRQEKSRREAMLRSFAGMEDRLALVDADIVRAVENHVANVKPALSADEPPRNSLFNPAMLNAMHDLLILYGTEAGQRDMQAVETLRRSLWNGLNHIVSQRVPDRRTAVQAVAGLGGGARVGQGPQAAFASFTATLFEAVLEEENV